MALRRHLSTLAPEFYKGFVESYDAGIYGCMVGTWVHGYMGAWCHMVPWCTRVHGAWCTRVHGAWCTRVHVHGGCTYMGACAKVAVFGKSCQIQPEICRFLAISAKFS